MLVNDTTLPPGADPTNAMTGYGAQTGGVATSNVNPDFMSTLQSQMMAQSGMISSANTGIEAAIQGAIGKVAESTSKGTQAIESKYTREADYLNTSQQNQITAMRERGVGMNTSDVAYKALASEADKNLKDLEMRKNELMLQNDAAGASKIADLMLQTSKMKVDAMQQTFQNLLAMSNFGLQAAQEKRAQNAQSFQEKATMANIQLEYGINAVPGESLDSLVTRASAIAGPRKAAELAKIVSETRKNNADAAKALADGNFSSSLNNPGTLAILGSQYRDAKTRPVIESKVKNNPELNAIANAAKVDEANSAEEFFKNQASSGKTVADIDNVLKLWDAELVQRGQATVSGSNIIDIARKTLPSKSNTPASKGAFENWKDTVKANAAKNAEKNTKMDKVLGGRTIPEGGLIGQFFK